ASFADGFAEYDIVQPALRIDGLPGSKASSAANDNFYVDVGVPRSSLSNLQTTQKVRTGSAGVVITVCSSDSTIGQIARAGVTGTCRNVTLAAGQSRTPTDAGNTFQFDAINPGVTVVGGSAFNHIVTDAGTVDVNVSGN